MLRNDGSLSTFSHMSLSMPSLPLVHAVIGGSTSSVLRGVWSSSEEEGHHQEGRCFLRERFRDDQRSQQRSPSRTTSRAEREDSPPRRRWSQRSALVRAAIPAWTRARRRLSI